MCEISDPGLSFFAASIPTGSLRVGREDRTFKLIRSYQKIYKQMKKHDVDTRILIITKI